MPRKLLSASPEKSHEEVRKPTSPSGPSLALCVVQRIGWCRASCQPAWYTGGHCLSVIDLAVRYVRSERHFLGMGVEVVGPRGQGRPGRAESPGPGRSAKSHGRCEPAQPSMIVPNRFGLRPMPGSKLRDYRSLFELTVFATPAIEPDVCRTTVKIRLTCDAGSYSD